jgi:hypothetical protein
VGDEGLETRSDSPHFPCEYEPSGAESGAVASSAQLLDVIRAWPSLNKDVRDSIVAVIIASQSTDK